MGVSPCAPCGERSMMTAASNQTCVCGPGAFTRSRLPDTTCEECPPGGVCEGGLSGPKAMPGFVTGPEANTFVVCLRGASAGLGVVVLCVLLVVFVRRAGALADAIEAYGAR